MAQDKKPDFIAYDVTGKEDRRIWNRVGAAWNHNDGKGISIRLSALPLSGEVTLRVPKEKSEGNEA